MKYPVHISKRAAAVFVTVAAIIITAGLLIAARRRGQSAPATAAQQTPSNSGPSSSEPALDLTSSQLNAIKIEAVGKYLFPVEEDAVGSIDFDGDVSVQVFPLYQGTVLQTLVALGAQVQKEQPLYTIKSPDLIQAESNLIGAAATFELTSKELARATSLNGANGVSQRELEQATSDQQTAEGALKAARDAVRVFGKTDAEIDLIRWRRLQHVAQEDGPVAHGELPRLQTCENLHAAVPSQPNLDDSVHKMAAITGHPSGHRAIGFAHHAVRRQGRGFHRIVDTNHEVRQHSWVQLIVRIDNLGARGYAMCVRVHCGVNLRDFSFELPTGIGHHFHLHGV